MDLLLLHRSTAPDSPARAPVWVAGHVSAFTWQLCKRELALLLWSAALTCCRQTWCQSFSTSWRACAHATCQMSTGRCRSASRSCHPPSRCSFMQPLASCQAPLRTRQRMLPWQQHMQLACHILVQRWPMVRVPPAFYILRSRMYAGLPRSTMH